MKLQTSVTLFVLYVVLALLVNILVKALFLFKKPLIVIFHKRLE